MDSINILHFASVPSTNDRLKDLAKKGMHEGTVVMAEKQTRGKGRLGKKWYSHSDKGLYFSLLLEPRHVNQNFGLFSLFPAISVVRSINELTHGNAGIKWPNDVVVGDQKISGILVESQRSASHIHSVIIGIGVNVKQQKTDFPPDIKATSVLELSEKMIKKKDLLDAILNHIRTFYSNHQLICDEQTLINIWENHCIHLNKTVMIKNDHMEKQGIFAGIGKNGAARIKFNDGQETLYTNSEYSIKEWNDVTDD